jgi:succinate-semialdehyde dehydrogenase/glutarate-semialdehyde dehydrogenase
VLFKPSEVAPLSGLRLAEIVEQVAPSGVLDTVVGDAATVADTWIEDPRVRGISFTGSTRVGRVLAGQAAASLTRCVLELGGNAPFVILDDADTTRAAQVLAVAKYRNNGQSCIAANRVWVPRSMLDDLVAEFADLSNTLVTGEPLDETTTLGALALPGDPDRMTGLLADAEGAGATVLPSAVQLPQRGQFAKPGICVDPPGDARVVTEEIFGPACSITGYTDFDEVLSATRSNPLGLAGYVIGRDTARAAQVARALDVGIVGINNAAPNTPQIPFAGLKLSGVGAEGGDAGLDEFLTDQSVAVAR